jgi:hypothetical protein
MPKMTQKEVEDWADIGMREVGLRPAIRQMAEALAAGEWAEHVSPLDPDVTALECEITKLVGRVNAGVPGALAPLNGIAATWQHDEGAYAQCGDCGRYTLNPRALRVSTHACECGSATGWSGSFKRPGPDAKWSGKAPDGVGVKS